MNRRENDRAGSGRQRPDEAPEPILRPQTSSKLLGSELKAYRRPYRSLGRPTRVGPIRASYAAYDHGESGLFNVADPGDEVSTGRATVALGWRADFRISAE